MYSIHAVYSDQPSAAKHTSFHLFKQFLNDQIIVFLRKTNANLVRKDRSEITHQLERMSNQSEQLGVVLAPGN